MNGFPDSISVELQQLPDVATMSVSDLIPRARVLTVNRASTSMVTTGAVAYSRPFVSKEGRQKQGVERVNFKGKCFRCEGPHMARECPERRPVKCYACGQEGHISYNCPNSAGKSTDQGN